MEKTNFKERVFDFLEDVVAWPIRFYKDVRGYVRCRWFLKTHCLSSTMDKGDFYDFDVRLISCAFDSFVYFIETEWLTQPDDLSGPEESPDEPEKSLEQLQKEFYDRLKSAPLPPLRPRQYPDLALKKLQKRAVLSEDDHEVLILYQWWKDRLERDKRGEVFWLYDDDEGTEMLIRLVKIRHFLWV